MPRVKYKYYSLFIRPTEASEARRGDGLFVTIDHSPPEQPTSPFKSHFEAVPMPFKLIFETSLVEKMLKLESS